MIKWEDRNENNKKNNDNGRKDKDRWKKSSLSEIFPVNIVLKKIPKDYTIYKKLEIWTWRIPLERIFFVNEKIYRDEIAVKDFSKKVRETLRRLAVEWVEMSPSYEELIKTCKFSLPNEDILDFIHLRNGDDKIKLIRELIDILWKFPEGRRMMVEKVYKGIPKNYIPLFRDEYIPDYQIIEDPDDFFKGYF
jgi:hypothetical protein